MSDGSLALREGEVVLLRERSGETVLVRLARGAQSIDRVGVISLDGQIGQPPGGAISWAGKEFTVLRPSLADLLGRLHRKAQIITPKDAQYLLYLAGVAPGSRVAEAGSGSGALTIVLAHAVGPDGEVVSFDRRADFLDVARANVESSGLASRVRFVERDVAREGLGENEFDSVLLDLPEPWAVLPATRTALRIGGHVGTYTPTYNQLERTVRELRNAEFSSVRSVELIEREIHVGEGGTRPEFDMLGHTGFLTGARKVRQP